MIRRVRKEAPQRSRSRGHALLINITVVHANSVSIRMKGKRKTENKQGKLDQDALTRCELNEKEKNGYLVLTMFYTGTGRQVVTAKGLCRSGSSLDMR